MSKPVVVDSPHESEHHPDQFQTEVTHMNTSMLSSVKPESSIMKNQINFKFDHFRMNQKKAKKHSKRAKSGNFKNLS